MLTQYFGVVFAILLVVVCVLKTFQQMLIKHPVVRVGVIPDCGQSLQLNFKNQSGRFPGRVVAMRYEQSQVKRPRGRRRIVQELRTNFNIFIPIYSSQYKC